MTIRELIVSRRSVRQFQNKAVSGGVLKDIVDAGRLAPSAANLQPLEFLIVDDPALRAEVFPCLKWAAYIHPEGNPQPGREPAAYVFVLVNTKIREHMYEYDVGAAVENMALAAAGEGIAGCWLISIDRLRIKELFRIPVHIRIDSVLALGYPSETAVVEPCGDSVRYWKDADGVFHVPKRSLDAVVHLNSY